MLRCPTCDSDLPAKSAATSFTASRRIERYWCSECRGFQKASISRDFDREDEGVDYSGTVLWKTSDRDDAPASAAVLWDLGVLRAGHPFGVRFAA